ncbi:bacteriocin-type signal sequence [uncultured Phocaeicola sp.]|uniref:bacteriocin-type signal sequence n=1 Tax=uncultured Phocaeicola sp. TaxID=990718 RepID=UPI002600935E|nr:bacteriocin-type signal sequence [uncultured Phocaeicola sp.]
MKKKESKTLKKEEMRNVFGGVISDSNGESCTTHGLPDIFKKDILEILNNRTEL